MTIRSTGYSNHEDVLLCQVYLDISQNPITSKYQSSDQFWSFVEKNYNEGRNQQMVSRSKRSVQSRMLTIIGEVKKLNGYLKQVKNSNPSGASDLDILLQAKELFMQEPKFKRGFKFDHVWHMVKDFEKFKENVLTAKQTARQLARAQNVNYVSSQSDNPPPELPVSSSPRLSSFSPDLNEDGFGGTSSQQPCEAEKTKLKRKTAEDMAELYTNLREENKQLLEMLKMSNLDRQMQMDIHRQNIALKKEKEENKILLCDLSIIGDPNVREFIRAEQRRIVEKRNQQGLSSSTDALGRCLSNAG